MAGAAALRSEGAFSTWLYRIAHNAVYDWMR
jgi:DNA-directed RNA polymerase specialized sigma24 family protein